MIRFFQSTFERQMRSLASETGLSVSDIDKDSALFRSTEKYPDYFVCVALHESGKVLLMCASHSKWQRRAPGAAHVLMEEFDKRSEHVSFLVRTNDEGVTRCWGMSRLRSLNSLDAETLSSLAAEMIVMIATGDRMLRERGYA